MADKREKSGTGAYLRAGVSVRADQRLSNSLCVTDDGSFTLSSDIKKLVPQQRAQAVVTGVYVAGSHDVNVSLRVVRLTDNRTISTVSYVFPNGPTVSRAECESCAPSRW
jgi:hypothetical protein